MNRRPLIRPNIRADTRADTASTKIRDAGLLALALALLLTGALSVPAAAQAPRATAPEPIHDAGAVVRGNVIEHRFTIRNEGDGPLRIREVEPACGCTVTEYDETIAAGSSGSILATVKTKDFRGPIAKAISVYTDDPQNARIQLVVKADVRTLVEVTPVYARFMTVVGESRDATEHLLWSVKGPPLEVLDVKSPFPYLKAEAREATEEERSSDGGDRQWKLTLELGDNAPVGPMRGFVEVQTNHPRQKTVKLPVSGYVRPVLSVTPVRADFGRRELEAPYKASVVVDNLGSDPVTLDGVTADVAGIETAIEELEEGKKFVVRLTLTPDMAKGPFEGTLQISTSSRLQPTLEVDLRGSIL